MGVTMGLEELRQRSEQLRRTLAAEAIVRTREDGASANLTELTGCAIAEEDKPLRDASDMQERADIAEERVVSAKLRSTLYETIDETCFHNTESNMRRNPVS